MRLDYQIFVKSGPLNLSGWIRPVMDGVWLLLVPVKTAVELQPLRVVI